MSTPRYSEESEILEFRRNPEGKIIGFASGLGRASSKKIAAGYKLDEPGE